MPPRSGLTRPLLTGENPKVNPWADEETSAKLLSAAGYRTALAGKWHLGEMPGTHPHQVGYDEYFGILSVVSEMSQVIDAHIYPDLVNNPARKAAVSKLVLPEITAGEKGPAHARGAAPEDDRRPRQDGPAVRRLLGQVHPQDGGARPSPSILVHAFSRLHNDNYPAPGYAGKSPAGFPYKDAVIEVDDIVGRIMKTLKDTGQLENTFVFFTSDNGANEDVWPDTGHQPWRGGTGHDLGRWRARARHRLLARHDYAPGRESDGLFDISDLFNTALSLAGQTGKISTARYVDGIDQTPLLLADNGESARQTVFLYNDTTLTAMRWKEYKVHMRVFQTANVRQNIDESTLVATAGAPWVYNLYTDPKEQRSSGHRYFEWGLPRVLGFLKSHAGTYGKYPMKDLGLAVPR